MMRAKMQVTTVRPIGEGDSAAEILQFNAVGPHGSYPADGSDENNTFARWTPSAKLEMYVNNPALHGKFVEGQEFYVDFTPAG